MPKNTNKTKKNGTNFDLTTDSLKSDSHLKRTYFVCFNVSLLKIMKNVFSFILKAFFVLKMLKFLS